MPSPPAGPSRRDGWRLLRETVRRHRGWTAVGVIAGVVWTAAKVTIPSLSRRAIDQGIIHPNTHPSALRNWTLTILCVGVVSAMCTGLRRYSAFGVA
jgi:ATP-binding cassette, subfamily B, bacterial